MSEHSDARAPHLGRVNAGKNTHARVFELLQQYVPSGRVMDIPSGEGSFSRRLLEGNYTVLAGDIEADPSLPEVDFTRCDMDEPFDIQHDSLDGIVCIEGIEHLNRPVDFISECRRILKPNGFMILTTPNISSLRSRWRWFMTGFHNKCKHPLDETNPEPRHHINMTSYPELRYILHTQGFESIHVTTNRIKLINWLYAPLAPIQYLITRYEFSKAKKNDINHAIAKSVLKVMYSKDVLFGESLIVVSRKK